MKKLISILFVFAVFFLNAQDLKFQPGSGGATGATGPTGATGATGPTGASGISNDSLFWHTGNGVYFQSDTTLNTVIGGTQDIGAKLYVPFDEDATGVLFGSFSAGNYTLIGGGGGGQISGIRTNNDGSYTQLNQDNLSLLFSAVSPSGNSSNINIDTSTGSTVNFSDANTGLVYQFQAYSNNARTTEMNIFGSNQGRDIARFDLEYQTNGAVCELQLSDTNDADHKLIWHIDKDSMTLYSKLNIDSGLQIKDGTQGAGKVLVSDAVGNASWTDDTLVAWGLTGNTGTDPFGGNYIGTNDNVPFIIKVNGIASGRIENDDFSYGNYGNTWFGYSSGLNTAPFTGGQNCGFGDLALSANINGNDNTAIGYYSMVNNDDGTANTAIGHGSLQLNVHGNENIAVGVTTLLHCLSNANTAVGFNSGNAIVNGVSNCFVGDSADAISDVSYSAAYGKKALVGRDSAIVLGDTITTKYVGIGTAYPISQFDVRGDFHLGATDSVSIYATTPADFTIRSCSDCSGNGVLGRLLIFIDSAWRRLTFE